MNDASCMLLCSASVEVLYSLPGPVLINSCNQTRSAVWFGGRRCTRVDVEVIIFDVILRVIEYNVSQSLSVYHSLSSPSPRLN